jgi:hypothetical protein
VWVLCPTAVGTAKRDVIACVAACVARCVDGALDTRSGILEVADEFVHKVPCGLIDEQLALDLPVGVEDGGVVAAPETPSDRREGMVRELAAQVHGDLASIDNLTAAPG